MYTHILNNLHFGRGLLMTFFLIWPHGKESLIRFTEHLNRVHPTIKFTSDISDKEIAFLDVTIYIYHIHIYTLGYIPRVQIDTCTYTTHQNTQSP